MNPPRKGRGAAGAGIIGARKRAQVRGLPQRVVVVGASLGGLEALQLLLSALPESFGPPVLIAQHRRPERGSHLTRLLSRGCPLPVSEPEDRQPLSHGHVYLAPPDYHLLVERGLAVLSVDAPVLHARPSIDVLFQSAAQTYGAATAAVLLTGASSDGAAGAAEVKGEGGLTIVQDPQTAYSAVAPEAALALMKPSFVLDLPDIAPVLVRWSESSGVRRVEMP